MDLHYSELIFDESVRNVPLKEVSFRNIDQEFVVVHSAESFESEAWNHLFYCYIKPYEGLFFRLIGISDENNDILRVDEERTKKEDAPYAELANERISKIVENGDLLSNRLIVDLPDEFYDRDDLKDLLETRRLAWLDEVRMEGNPDMITVPFCDRPLELKLVKCQGEVVLTEDKDGVRFLYDRNGEMMKYCEG